MLESPAISMTVPLNWQPVLVREKPFPWHRKSPDYQKDLDLIRGSRVYRWVFRDKMGEVKKAYIGQSGAFHDRIANYRSIAKGDLNSDNGHLAVFKTWGGDGGVVELQFLDFPEFQINSQRISAKNLGDLIPRLFLENLAILSAISENFELLNKIPKNVYIREFMDILGALAPEEARALVQQALANLKENK